MDFFKESGKGEAVNVINASRVPYSRVSDITGGEEQQGRKESAPKGSVASSDQG